ncbi:MAG TPA: STING domain-containing protein [Chthoniobacterales bacterium]|nr:STING domain-containing protein [Chthoniobacterales bacterium]
MSPANIELLKVILGFLGKIAYPLILALFLILFRREIANLGRMLLDFGQKVTGGIERGDLGLKYGDWSIEALKKVRSENLDSAARTIQELLSPAAPLALGYVDNFLGGFVIGESGCFKYERANELSQYRIVGIFTVYIPRTLEDLESSSQSLVHDVYGSARAKNISIQSKYGRAFTAFAVLHEGTLFPVDVPKTLTSIQHVFNYRGEQLRIGGMKVEDIKRLEEQNLTDFANIVKERTKALQQSGCIRVVRKSEALFSENR